MSHSPPSDTVRVRNVPAASPLPLARRLHVAPQTPLRIGPSRRGWVLSRRRRVRYTPLCRRGTTVATVSALAAAATIAPPPGRVDGEPPNREQSHRPVATNDNCMGCGVAWALPTVVTQRLLLS